MSIALKFVLEGYGYSISDCKEHMPSFYTLVGSMCVQRARIPVHTEPMTLSVKILTDILSKISTIIFPFLLDLENPIMEPYIVHGLG